MLGEMNMVMTVMHATQDMLHKYILKDESSMSRSQEKRGWKKTPLGNEKKWKKKIGDYP